MVQNNQGNFNGQNLQEKPKGGKRNIIRLVFIGVLLALFVLFIFYAFYYEGGESVDGNQTTVPPPTQPGEEEGESPFGWIIFFVVLGLIVLSGYLFFGGKIKDSLSFSHKTEVTPDRAEEIFIENFALKKEIMCVYKEGKYLPANPNAVIVNDKIPFFHAPTGDNFLFLEVEVREGKQQGIHTVIMPIDKGEDVIKNGYYRIDTHTPKFQFRLNPRNFPMSSMKDKQDRMNLLMMQTAQEDEGGNLSNLMKFFSGSGGTSGQEQPQAQTQPPNYPPTQNLGGREYNPQQTIFSSYDEQTGEQATPPPPQSYRKRSYPRRRYSRYGR